MQSVHHRRDMLKAAGLILAVFLIGTWFRVYSLAEAYRFKTHDSRVMAEIMVKRMMGQQLALRLSSSQPGLSPQDLQRHVTAQVEAAAREDSASFQKAVQDFLQQMPETKNTRYQHHYLLGADSYHFLRLTQNLAEKGQIAETFKGGKYFDPLRTTPDGFWTPVPWHPYLGYFIYRALDIFLDIPLMEAVGYVPLILLFPLCIFFYALCRELKFDSFAAFAASMTLLMAPVFLQRSYFGWYDTDIYNLLFPVLILVLSLRAYSAEGRQFWVLAVSLSVVTAVYSFFWVGWPFIFLIVTGMGFIFYLARKFLKQKSLFPGAGKLTGVYFFLTAVLIAVLSSPAQLLEYLTRGIEFVGKFGSGSLDVWPNIFLTVGETHSVTPKRLMYLCGNQITFAFAFAGVLAGYGQLRKGLKPFLVWAFFLCMSLPLLYLSLKTERFSLLFVIPLAVLTGYGFAWIQELVLAAVRAVSRKEPDAALRTAAGCVLVLVILPLQLIFGHALGMKNAPIMNNAWHTSLIHLRDNTPENSIIYSWWPPGYFLTSIAKRRVFADGGTQHLPETYWLARVFLSTTEKEALGIIRMMNKSGNKAVEYLQSKGVPLYEVIDILNVILPRSREESRSLLLNRFDAATADGLLNLTHSGGLNDPTYIYLYNEMVDKNLALSLLAKWNFREAAEQRKAKKKPKKADYIEEVIALSGGVLKYQPESPLAGKDGEWLVFDNGLRFNPETMEAVIERRELNVKGRPVTVSYFDGTQMHEKIQEGNLLDLSALIVHREESYICVLADLKLIRSLLFRLYYIDGRDLEAFELVDEVEDRATDTEIQIFKVNLE